jgi:hypothetical protein
VARAPFFDLAGATFDGNTNTFYSVSGGAGRVSKLKSTIDGDMAGTRQLATIHSRWRLTLSPHTSIDDSSIILARRSLFG